MLRKLYFLLLCFLAAPLFAQKLTLPSLQHPPATASLFGEGFVSTRINERDFALTPDGNEIYYTISSPKSTIQTIVVSRRNTKGEWSQPEIAPFAAAFSNLEPALTGDGKTLFFASNRPLTGTEPKDFDIWKVTRTATGWSNPERLSEVINTEADEFYPSIASNGNLYFTAAYRGGPGREDIYCAMWREGAFQKPVALDSGVNTKFYEFNAFVTPDEQYILFTSYGRKDDTGGGDLYISAKKEGRWTPARNLKELNSPQIDYCPYVSPDGKVLFFTSERHQLPVTFSAGGATVENVKKLYDQPLDGTGNIYWVDFSKFK